MKFKRAAYKVEPKLKLHRHIVAVGHAGKDGWKTQYHYCANLKEVVAVKKRAPVGSVIEVFEAKHSFTRAWVREA